MKIKYVIVLLFISFICSCNKRGEELMNGHRSYESADVFLKRSNLIPSKVEISGHEETFQDMYIENYTHLGTKGICIAKFMEDQLTGMFFVPEHDISTYYNQIDSLLNCNIEKDSVFSYGNIEIIRAYYLIDTLPDYLVLDAQPIEKYKKMDAILWLDKELYAKKEGMMKEQAHGWLGKYLISDN